MEWTFLTLKILITDILASGKGLKTFTRDFIGAGPRTVAGILNSFNIESKITLLDDIKSTKMNNYDVLMISGMSMDFIACQNLVKAWRRTGTGKKPVILGGPITSGSLKFLKRLDFDIAVMGEGELVISNMVKYEILYDFMDKKSALEKIEGITWKDVQELKTNPSKSYLDKATFNKFRPSTTHVRDYPNYFIARVYVECVRGCSNFNRTKLQLLDGRKCSNCTICEEKPNDRMECPQNIPPGCGYCSVPSVYGPSKSKTKDNIIQDVQGLIREGVRKIVLGGPDFLDYERESLSDSKWLMDPKHPGVNVEEIENLLTDIHLIEEVKKEKVFVSIENIKPHLFSEEVASIIAKNLPNTYMSIGCETGSASLAKSIGRPSLPSDAINAVKLAKKHGIKVHCYFIHNLPGQDEAAARETREMMNKLQEIGLEKITLYKFKPLPGAALENHKSLETRHSKMLKKAAIKINYKLKKAYMNKEVRLLISEQHFKDPTIGMGVFLTEGPTVLVPDAGNLIGKEVKVKITDVISDKLIKGSLVSNKKK